MRIYICDDEPQMLSDIAKRVQDICPAGTINGFHDGGKLLEALHGESCDILLLDIDMPHITGLDIAGKLSGISMWSTEYI